MGKKWLNLVETGQLYLEQILVTFNIPILFVCHGFENRKYLCLNVDEEVETTVIAETDSETLLAMLQNKLTMETVFRNSFNNSCVSSSVSRFTKSTIMIPDRFRRRICFATSFAASRFTFIAPAPFFDFTAILPEFTSITVRASVGWIIR